MREVLIDKSLLFFIPSFLDISSKASVHEVWKHISWSKRLEGTEILVSDMSTNIVTA